MFFSLTALTDPALKRLYKFVLKRVLGRFLQHDLDMSQLQVHLRQGTLHLVELELNATAINDLLRTSGLPFQMKRGFVGSVKVTVSYTNMLNESCLIDIDDIDMVLEPVSASRPHPTPTPPTTPTSTPPTSTMQQINEGGNYDYDTDTVAQEGLDFVATWIERVTSKVKVTVTNLCITLEDSATCPVALMLHVPWMQLVDETPQEAYPSASILKGVQWKGMRVEIVHLHRDSIEETAAPFSVVPILVCDPVRPSYVQIKMYPSTLLEVDLFVPHIEMLIQPKHLGHLAQLAALLSTPPASSDTHTPSSTPSSNLYMSICDPQQAATWLAPDGSDESNTTASSNTPDNGFPTLSLAEFKRIERLLQQYQEKAQRPLSGSAPSVLRRQSSSEGGDSVVGLSDLEDEEDLFHDCNTSNSMLGSVHHGSMGQSMYMSARQPEDSMVQRIKMTVLSLDMTMVYEDVLDDPDETDHRNEAGTLPDASRMERLVWHVQEMLVQAILHPPQPKNVHMSFHHVTCEERLIPRLSMSDGDADDGSPPAMLAIPWLRFLGDEKDVMVHMHLDAESTRSTCVVHAQPLQVEVDMFMLNRLQAFLNAVPPPTCPTDVTRGAPIQVEVHLPFVHIHLRFPLIPSDRIRFGPSSRRGLAEDTLQLHFHHVKLGKHAMTWDQLHIDLHYPPAFNPRDRGPPCVASICSSTVHAQCSWSVHTPTLDKLQAAASVRANMKETFGSDAEQGEVSIGGGVDAWRQTDLLEQACVAASATVVKVHIPDATVVIDKTVYDRLMVLTDALVSINPVDITGLTKVTTLQPCGMSLEIVCDGFHVRLKHENLPEYRLELEHVRIFSLVSWLGSLTSRLHVVAQELTLFEENTPVLYKIAWGRPHEGPLLLFLQETTELAEDMRDISLHLHFSHLTWRYDMASNWLGDCLHVLLTTYPPAIVPLDTPHGADDSIDMTQAPIPLAMPTKTVFTKLVVQCYESVLDYAPPGISARALLVLGKLCLSSNLVTDAAVQGYKVSVAELGLFVHPMRVTPDVYVLENRWLDKSASRGALSMRETIENLGFLEVSTLDFADVFVRVSEDDQMNLELCLGTIKLKVCFDSFETMRLVCITWWDEFAKNSPPPKASTAAPVMLVAAVDVADTETAPTTSLNVLDQIDFNMFQPKTNAPSVAMRDTEARLLKTQVHEAMKPPVQRRLPSTPLVIEDFFSHETKQGGAESSPWFISDTTPSATSQPSTNSSLSSVQPRAGSPALVEASARWIPPEAADVSESLPVHFESSFKAVDEEFDDDVTDDLTMSVSINDTEEVELDLHLDGDMRLELNRLLEEEDDDPAILTEDEEASPRHSVLSPPDSPTSNENSARWYSDGNFGNPDPPAIYLHHVEIPIAGAAAALSFGEKELASAIQTMTNECPQMKTPVMVKSILLRDFNVEMRLFGGHDWQPSSSAAPTVAATTPDKASTEDKAEKKQKLLDALLENYVDDSDKLLKNKPKSRPSKHRKTEEMLELRLANIKLRLDLYAEDTPQPLAQNTVLHVGDVEILDYISTSQIRKLLCYWKSDTFHPRETGTPLIHLHLVTVRSTMSAEEEHRLKLKFLPLRINLDQDVLDFLKQFSRPTNSESPPTDDSAAFPKPDLPVPLHAPTVISEKPEMAPGAASFFFQSVDIRSFKIKIDYRPQRVDFQALQAGDYLEVINLFVLEGMELSLRHIKLSGVSNWDALINQTLVHWVQDISRHQIHKCLASVVPMRSISNIGAGAADLILLPMAQYGKDRRVIRGLRKGATSFLKSVTIETLNTASKLARGTKSLLETADHVMQDSKKKKTQFNSRKGNTHARYLISQPANATEGWNQAYASMSRELHVVAKTIVAVPLLEYQRTGSHGYVKSVIRAVPVAVLRPMIGATEAVSRALIGVRNAVDPEMKEDMENKFKDMS
ncbi:hypothetical protein H310_08237 [Aphanomyces invadans]|uniref:Autophagy-related protein 2 n=1 Tax=Aphanomyces invadans TaxID=157072 RepID=A0A024U1U7_9STRA|nr:hypothetical protein H310_08237 [Aphanomyces invadans]ETV99582.1 hypothetical protein H310_08237 [Aphanomyces invadans]|eukprot:XP_008872138.1 hypothetical protein H310_08237 [Aphanomyces invadans]